MGDRFLLFNCCYMGRDHGERRHTLEHEGQGEGRDSRGMEERHLLFNCCYGTGSWRTEAGFRAHGTGRGRGRGTGERQLLFFQGTCILKQIMTN